MTSKAAIAIAAGRKELGIKYILDTENPGHSFDCSGLVQWAYRQAGITLPRTAAEQQRATTRVSRADLAPGDLVFYGSPAHHVGIYVGGGQFLEAPHTGTVVKITGMGSPTNFGRVSGSGAAGTAAQDTGAVQTTALSTGGSASGPPTSTVAFDPFKGPLSFLGGIWHTVSGVPTDIGDVAQAMNSMVQDMGQVMAWLTWIFDPHHFLRIGAFFVGLIVLFGGFYYLRKALDIGPTVSDGVSMFQQRSQQAASVAMLVAK